MRFVTMAHARLASSKVARVVLALLVLVGLALTIAEAAGAATPAKPQTWVGQVERDGGHFDYVGRACPVEAEFCIEIIARYRIVPVTPSAARALPQVAGGTARLLGTLVSGGNGGHLGTLFVSQVSKV